MRNFKKIVDRVFRNRSTVSFANEAYVAEVQSLQNMLLKNDTVNGDITSNMLIDDRLIANAKIIAKGKGILAGIQELDILLSGNKSLNRLKVRKYKKDGYSIKKGDVIVEVVGYAKELLSIERTVLNLLQRMSGIATYTDSMANKVSGRVLISSTRKTVWGALDKRACYLGGGGTHRVNLGDAVLIKNNHISLCRGGYTQVLNMLKVPESSRFVDFEVRTRLEADKFFKWISEEGKSKVKVPVIVMFDNFTTDKLRCLIRELKAKYDLSDIILEASGGIDESNLVAYSKTGVDVLSIGALTHSVQALDISMKIKPV